MQLKMQWPGVSGQRSVLLFFAAFLVTHHSSLITEVKAEDSFNVKYQHYDDDKSLYYKDTKGTMSDQWLVSIAKTISEKTSLALSYGVDAVSSASWKIDGVTSASRRAGEEDRHNGSIGISRAFETANLSAGVGLSRENNYNSDYIYASISQDFNKKNTTAGLSVSRAWDEIYSTKTGDARDFPKDKDTSTIGLSLTQILTPWTIASIGHEYSIVNGYQAHPEDTVLLSDGSYTDEVHPDSRFRNAGVLRVNQYLPWKGAVHVDYRYYHDSWGINSNTLGLKYYQYLYKDLILRARYRYYSQGASDFYTANPTPDDLYPTIDGKLRDFDSEMYGLKLIYDVTKIANKIGIKAAEKVKLDIKYDRYRQLNGITGGEDGLNANIVQVGLGMEF